MAEHVARETLQANFNGHAAVWQQTALLRLYLQVVTRVHKPLILEVLVELEAFADVSQVGDAFGIIIRAEIQKSDFFAREKSCSQQLAVARAPQRHVAVGNLLHHEGVCALLQLGQQGGAGVVAEAPGFQLDFRLESIDVFGNQGDCDVHDADAVRLEQHSDETSLLGLNHSIIFEHIDVFDGQDVCRVHVGIVLIFFYLFVVIVVIVVFVD
mmetsp:Transcript_21581/g.48112  ORF Transcript_21581/g.48112 Transcript_21581/m.48112 type:complete len:212 (+) Transcript_21581:928-1563(+)